MTDLRIMRLAGVHRSLPIDWFRSCFQGFDEMSYAERLKSFLSLKLMYSDSFSFYMSQFGHEVAEIVWDCDVLQKTWGEENGVNTAGDNWRLNVLLGQITRFRPEVVFIQGTELCIPGRFNRYSNTGTFAQALRESCPFIRVISMFSGYPGDPRRVQETDLLFAGSPSIVRNYQYHGKDAILCYHGFDERIAPDRHTLSQEKSIPFSFVGSTRAPESRYWLLRQLMEETSLRLWADQSMEEQAFCNSQHFKKLGWPHQLQQLIRNKAINMFSLLPTMFQNYLGEKGPGKKIKNLTRDALKKKYLGHSEVNIKDLEIGKRVSRPFLSQRFPERCFKSVVGLEYFSVLSKSVVTLNHHTDNCLGSAGNMRLFEATGVGACLLTDHMDNITTLFEVEQEILTYRTVREAIDKSNYLSRNISESLEIAEAGQRRTLRDHTVLKRCQIIDEAIRTVI